MKIEVMENGSPQRDWFAPIIADAEAGFGGVLNAFEITRNYVDKTYFATRESMSEIERVIENLFLINYKKVFHQTL